MLKHTWSWDPKESILQLFLWCLQWKQYSRSIPWSNVLLWVTEHRFSWHRNLLHSLRSAFTRAGLFTLMAQIQGSSTKVQPQPKKPCDAVKPFLFAPVSFRFLNYPLLANTLRLVPYNSFYYRVSRCASSEWWGVLGAGQTSSSLVLCVGQWLEGVYCPFRWQGTHIELLHCKQAHSNEDAHKTLTWCMLVLIWK